MGHWKAKCHIGWFWIPSLQSIIVPSFSFTFLLVVQSLSGHSSAVESVSFDSSEVLVAAGAASGTIKLWDLEEAKSKVQNPGTYNRLLSNFACLHDFSCADSNGAQIKLHFG